MDEVELNLKLFYEGVVSPLDLQELHDRVSEFIEREMEQMLALDDAELTDYEIDIKRN